VRAGQTAVAGGPPALPAKAWLLMDFDSGEVLASANPDEPLPPASLTKMMTSFLVEQALRSGKLKKDDLVTVSQNAWCRGSSTESCMYLPLNSQATVIDILRGIIIQSGNDASKAIAEHMAGSEEGFAKLMNAEAQRLGMTHTNFVNATGLPDPAHKSSARDLAILARAIIRDSADYYPIYAEREFKYNNIKQGNRNALLYTDPTVDGLKTGHTEEAGYCLVTSSKRNGMRLITVILNTNSAQARADQTRTLLGWGFGNFEKATPDPAERGGRDGQGQASARPTRWPRAWARRGHDRAARPAGADLGAAQARPGGAGGQGRRDRQGGRELERQAGGEAPLVAQADVERAGFMLRSVAAPGCLRARRSSAGGSRCAMAPVDAPTRTRPVWPASWRRTSSTASSASASSLRARAMKRSPRAVACAGPRPRTSNWPPRRDSSSAIWTVTVGAAR
jgi:D-alanyl-D-alanine carboxypeptidase (penicillin-binding protein 5/6)